jgi:glycine cleavage system transcriptional repressor
VRQGYPFRGAPYPPRVAHYALSAIGRDRPGIVAAVTGVLLGHGANLEDSQMTILRGHFTMMLVIDLPDGADAGRLRADLDAAARGLGLEAIALAEVADADPDAPAEPSHILTVYGTDHPGIVNAVAEALAAAEVNITDLNTRLVAEDDGAADDLYAMMVEVSLPPGLSASALETLLAAIKCEQDVEVSVRELEADAL